MNLKNDDSKKKISPSFDWLGLFALIIGIKVPIWVMGYLVMFPNDEFILRSIVLVSLWTLIAFINRYNKKNIFVASILIICIFHPIRFLNQWWVNPIIYGLVTCCCLTLTWHTIKRTDWRHSFSILLMVCTLLLASQTVESFNEVGNCDIEDQRWNYVYACRDSGNWYQQIQSLPIGMQGWCYYCPWHTIWQ